MFIKSRLKYINASVMGTALLFIRNESCICCSDNDISLICTYDRFNDRKKLYHHLHNLICRGSYTRKTRGKMSPDPDRYEARRDERRDEARLDERRGEMRLDERREEAR